MTIYRNRFCQSSDFYSLETCGLSKMKKLCVGLKFQLVIRQLNKSGLNINNQFYERERES